MKFPFVSRLLFDEMLRDKNLQIRDLQVRIVRLENDRNAVWCTREHFNEMVKQKDYEIGYRDVRIAKLESELSLILEKLPVSSVDTLVVFPSQEAAVRDSPKPTPPEGGGEGRRSRQRHRGGQNRPCADAGKDPRPAAVVGPTQNEATGETAGMAKATLPETSVHGRIGPDDPNSGGRGELKSEVSSSLHPGILPRTADGPYLRMGRPRARDIVRKMDRVAHQRWLERMQPAKVAERMRDEVMAELNAAHREAVERAEISFGDVLADSKQPGRVSGEYQAQTGSPSPVHKAQVQFER